MPILGTDLALHLPLELGVNLAGALAPPPVLEAPELVPGLKAWFDSRSAAYFALGGAGEVSAWLSRGGSIASLAWMQGTASNQPVRVASSPLLNNMPEVQFDGVNDYLVTSDSTAWKFMHDGTGHSSVRIYRLDSSLATSQPVFANQNAVSQSGIYHLFTTASLLINIVKGVSPALNAWTNNVAAHYARDVSRWQMIGHETGTAHSRVSGSSLTDADDSAPPSAANPSAAARLGATVSGSSFMRGFIVQDLYYDHVLTAGEMTQLANWAAAIYGVAA